MEKPAFVPESQHDAYIEAVAEVLGAYAAGELGEAVLTRRLGRIEARFARPAQRIRDGAYSDEITAA